MSTNASKLRAILPLVVLIVIILGFFYKTLLFGKYPFPGDLLLTQYGPWRHQSYDGYVAGAIPTKNQYFDVIRELYPWKTVVVDQLKKGEIPFWNPYNFSGSPLLANFQSQVFYPLSLVYFFFSQITAWTIMVILQPVLGAVFMYLFARQLGLTTVASMLSALLFNFSGFAAAWMEFTTVWHTILWLPLLLYIVEKGMEQKSLFLWQKGVFVIGLASTITGGHPQDFLNTFLFFCIYTAARIVKHTEWEVTEKMSFVKNSLLPILVIPFLLALPQLLPTIELFTSSARVAHDYTNIVKHMLVQWWQLPLMAVADFFGNPATGSNFTGDYVGKTLSVGVAGFVLAVASLRARKKSWHHRFFIGAVIAILMVTVRTPVSELLYRFPLPILSTGTPTRILFLLAFALSMLSGYGYDHLKRQKHVRELVPAAIVWGVFVGLWIIVFVRPFMSLTPIEISVMKRALMFSSAVLFGVTIISVFSQKIRWMYVLILPLCIAELAYGFLKFNPFVPHSFVYPENALVQFIQKNAGLNRVWGYGTAEMEANFATQEKIFSTDGTDPLNLRWYNQFVQSSKDGNIPAVFTRTTRSDAKITPGYGESDLPTNRFRLKVIDTLAVRYVIDRVDNPKDDTTFDTLRFKPVWQKDAWTVFENMLASPRSILTGDVQFYNSDSDFQSKFFADTFVSGQSVLVEEIYKSDFSAVTPGTASAVIQTYTPNTVSIKTVSDGPRVLFLSDTYDPNWTASIDGTKTTVYKMTYAFRGVIVPAGEHTITFSYISKKFLWGVYISGITAFLCVLACVNYFLSKKIPRHG